MVPSFLIFTAGVVTMKHAYLGLIFLLFINSIFSGFNFKSNTHSHSVPRFSPAIRYIQRIDEKSYNFTREAVKMFIGAAAKASEYQGQQSGNLSKRAQMAEDAVSFKQDKWKKTSFLKKVACYVKRALDVSWSDMGYTYLDEKKYCHKISVKKKPELSCLNNSNVTEQPPADGILVLVPCNLSAEAEAWLKEQIVKTEKPIDDLVAETMQKFPVATLDADDALLAAWDRNCAFTQYMLEVEQYDREHKEEIDDITQLLQEKLEDEADTPTLSEDKKKFLMAQQQAYDEIAHREYDWTDQKYKVSDGVRDLCKKYNVTSTTFTELYGNQLQHLYHKQINQQLERFLQTDAAKNDFMHSFVFDLAVLAQEHVKVGNTIEGGALAGVLWWSVDIIRAVLEGLKIGSYNTLLLLRNLCVSPVKVACDMAKGVGNVLGGLGKFLGQEMAQADFIDALGQTDDITETIRLLEQNHKQRLILPIINKLLELPKVPFRDIVKEGTAIAFELALMRKSTRLAGRAAGYMASAAGQMTAETFAVWEQALAGRGPGLVLDYGGVITEAVAEVAEVVEVSTPIVEAVDISTAVVVGGLGYKVENSTFLARDGNAESGNSHRQRPKKFGSTRSYRYIELEDEFAAKGHEYKGKKVDKCLLEKTYDGVTQRNGKLGGKHLDYNNELLDQGLLRITKELDCGIYEAKIFHNGKWYTKTMFPSNMSPAECTRLMETTFEQYKHIAEPSQGKLLIKAPYKENVELWIIFKDDTIISFYPKILE